MLESDLSLTQLVNPTVTPSDYHHDVTIGSAEDERFPGLFAQNSAIAGLGLFTEQPFSPNDIIITFRGQVYDYDEIEEGGDLDHHCIQIGDRTYLGPSGGIDDYTNHSCNQNAGVRLVEGGVQLVAIKPITAREEVTFDYATCMDEDTFEMDCNCGSKDCRGRIRDFKYLPDELKTYYRELGIILDFLKDK